MSWIGLRDTTDAIFAPSGLGKADSNTALQLDNILTKGSLVIEYRYEPTDRPANILRYARRDPAAAVVTLRSDPDSTLSLLRRHGDRDTLYSLALPTLLQAERVAVHYSWDLALARGVFAVTLPERGVTHTVEVDHPLPLSWRDACDIATNPLTVQTHVSLDAVALADHVVPIGPQPCFDGAGLVATASNTTSIANLQIGDEVIAADGALAQVRWIGSTDVLTRGHGAPHLMRAPYLGVQPDLPVSGTAVMRLTGTEVEYLFGEAEVAVPIRHLADDQAILTLGPKPGQLDPGTPLPPVQRYYQLLLDRPVPLRISGAVFEPIDTREILANPALHRWSLLSGLPAELLPRGAVDPCMRLRDYEAQSLRQLQAA